MEVAEALGYSKSEFADQLLLVNSNFTNYYAELAAFFYDNNYLDLIDIDSSWDYLDYYPESTYDFCWDCHPELIESSLYMEANLMISEEFGVSMYSQQAYMIAEQQATYGSPIVIDLDGDGIETVSTTESKFMFDIDNDGALEKTGWLSVDDGFLAFDENQNDKIDGMNELFGGLIREEGFAKLAKFDSNHDDLIDVNDIDFDKLSIWKDTNQNGATDDNELFSLMEFGLTELSLDYSVQDIWQNGNLIGERSTALMNGETVEMSDVYFKYDDIVPGIFGVHRVEEVGLIG